MKRDSKKKSKACGNNNLFNEENDCYSFGYIKKCKYVTVIKIPSNIHVRHSSPRSSLLTN